MLLLLFLCGLLGLAALVLARYRQAARLGLMTPPLTAEERLRVALVVRNLEDAVNEVAKVAYADEHAVSTRVYHLQLELEEVRWHAVKLLRRDS